MINISVQLILTINHPFTALGLVFPLGLLLMLELGLLPP